MEWRTIEHTEERYIINEEGIVVDLRPQNNGKYNFWDSPLPRELNVNNRCVEIMVGGKRKRKAVNTLIRQTFPEFMATEQEKDAIMKRIKEQDSITYSVEDFNRLIWPNKMLALYDKTYNTIGHINPKDKRKKLWRKPNKVIVRPNGKFTLFKGHTYFGYGLTHLIHFDGLIPYNAKQFEECDSKEYMRKYANEKEKRKIHMTELW